MVTLAFNKPKSISTLFVSRQLYSLNSKPLTSKEKVELNRRFAKGFQILESSAEARAEAVQLFENIKSFEDFSKIYQLPIAYNVQRSSVFQDTVALVFYIVKCLNRIIFVLALITQAIPGVIFMGPMTSLVVYLSEKERVKCLKASKVKLHGNDVVGSYKIMVSLVLFPIFQIVNSLLTYFVLTKLDKFSVTTNRRIALAVFFLVPIYALIMVRSVDSLGQTFKKLKYMFIKVFKRDLLDTYEKNMRELSRAIRSAVDKFGGSVFTDFDDIRIIKKDELC